MTGLRIDHPDGLVAPADYLRQLQRRCFLALAEATAGLEDAGEDERSRWRQQALDELRPPRRRAGARRWPGRSTSWSRRSSWPTSSCPSGGRSPGTTGYDFLNAVNGLFVHRAAERALSDTYERFIAARPNFREMVYDAKQLIIDTSMASEISVLGRRLARISEKHRASRDFTTRSLTTALREIIASFPVYRTYIDASGADRPGSVARGPGGGAGSAAQSRHERLHLRRSSATCCACAPRAHAAKPISQAHLTFVGKFQQLTGPITAKGVEDTAFYRYHRLTSLNEVGGAPDRFGISVNEFHRSEPRASGPLAHRSVDHVDP